METEPKKLPEYSKLADIYDTLMEDVNYEFWADFIDAIILEHHSNPQKILELACGTGSVSLLLDELGYYKVMATDKSPQMIAKAKEKNKSWHYDVDFRVMDFLDIQLDQTFDVVFCVFDSVNYMHTPDQVHRFLGEVKKVLAPNGLLIFDFTTPKNSIQSIEYLNNEEGYTEDNHRYFRRSSYDADKQIHKNEFRIEKLADDRESVIEKLREIHLQKIYTLQQMLDIIDQTAYKVEAKYSGFEYEEADEKSLRITMVLRCPDSQ